MKKKIILALSVGSLLIAILGVYFLRQNQLPSDLERLLIIDAGSHTNVGFTTAHTPLIIQYILGDDTYLMRIRSIDFIKGNSINSPNAEACLNIRITFRDPRKVSVYSFGSPTEDYLYHVRKAEDEWTIRYLRHGTVNQRLLDNICPFSDDAN